MIHWICQNSYLNIIQPTTNSIKINWELFIHQLLLFTSLGRISIRVLQASFLIKLSWKASFILNIYVLNIFWLFRENDLFRKVSTQTSVRKSVVLFLCKHIIWSTIGKGQHLRSENILALYFPRETLINGSISVSLSWWQVFGLDLW